MLHARKQHGAALMVMLVILVLGAATVLVTSLNSSRLRMERDKITADALAQAKEALIGYAVKVALTKSSSENQARPGDLPCPDMDNDGDRELLARADHVNALLRLTARNFRALFY